MSDKNNPKEKPQNDEAPSTSRGARRKHSKSKGTKVEGDTYYTPKSSVENVDTGGGLLPDPRPSVSARKPPTGRNVPSFKSIVSDHEALYARRTDASFKSTISSDELPERPTRRRSSKRLSIIAEQAEPPPEVEVPEQAEPPAEVEAQEQEEQRRESKQSLRPSVVSGRSETPTTYKEVAQMLIAGGQKKKRRLKEKYLEKKKIPHPSKVFDGDESKSMYSTQSQSPKINVDGLHDETRSMHTIHVDPKNLKPIVGSGSSSELSENESLIWATTYKTKPGELGSDESQEWKGFKSAMKPEGEDTTSTTDSEEVMIVQEMSKQPSDDAPHEPADPPVEVESWGSRLKVPLLEFWQRWAPKKKPDETPEESSIPQEQPSKSPGLVVVKGKRIGDDVYFSPRESEASFLSLVSARSRRSHHYSSHRPMNEFRSAFSTSDIPVSRDHSFKSSLSSFMTESKQPRKSDVAVEKTEDDVEPPVVEEQIEPVEPIEPVETIEPPEPVEPAEQPVKVKRPHRGKVPKNLAHIEDLHEILTANDSKIANLSVGSKQNVVVPDYEAPSSSSSSTKSESEAFLWSGMYQKRMQKVESVQSQIQEWVTFKKTPKKMTNYDEDYSTDELENSEELLRRKEERKQSQEAAKVASQKSQAIAEDSAKRSQSEDTDTDKEAKAIKVKEDDEVPHGQAAVKRRTTTHFKRGSEVAAPHPSAIEFDPIAGGPSSHRLAHSHYSLAVDDGAEPSDRYNQRGSKRRTATHFRRGSEVQAPTPSHIQFHSVAAATSSHRPEHIDPDHAHLRKSHEFPHLHTIYDEHRPVPLVAEHDVRPQGIDEVVAAIEGIDTTTHQERHRSSTLSLLKQSTEATRMSTIRDELLAARLNEELLSKLKGKQGVPKQADENAQQKLQKTDRSSSSSNSNFSELGKQIRSLGSKLQTNLILGNAFVYMILPPDGGFGWVIMCISFLCQVIVDGIIFGVGLMLPDMARDLGVDSQTITLVASIQIGCYFLGASFASALINLYGFRPVAFCGALASVITIVSSTFSPNLPTLIVLYSIIGGITLSMIWVSSQLIVGYYFERNRPIANGISCSGAGVGIVVFCAMNSFLVPEIGWRNTSRVHAMILSSVLLLCLTYVEVPPTRVGQVKQVEPETASSHSTSEEYNYATTTYRYSKAYSIRQSLQSSHEQHLNDMLEVYVEPPKEHHSLRRRICGNCCSRPREMDGDPETNIAIGYVIRHDPIERQDLFYTGPAEYERREPDSTEILDNKQVELLMGTEKTMKTINYSLSVMQAARDPLTRRQTYMELKTSNVPNPMWAFLRPSNWLHPKIQAALRKLFDFRLLNVMEFQVLCASAFLFPMGFNIPFLYSKVRAEVDPLQAAFIAPAIGASNFVFRIFSGLLAQHHRSWTTYLCGGGMVFGGSFVFLSAFYGQDKVWFQYLYAASYGVAPAVYSTLRAIIYVRSLGLDKLTNAFGMTALAMACGVFTGTTLAGILNQQTGGYTASFAFGGVCIMTAGTLKLILPLLTQSRERESLRKRVTFK